MIEAANELALTDPTVSRIHAEVKIEDQRAVVRDLGSTNGTRVNGHRVTELVLGEGDRIQIGETSLVVEAAPAGTGARS